MPLINENFLKLQAGYLFPEIARRVRTFAEKHPGPPDHQARHRRRDRTARAGHRRGHAEGGRRDDDRRRLPRDPIPSKGYDFLRSAIATNDYRSRGCDVADNEIFVSDGSKCDSANLLDILGHGNTIAVTDPVYPVYVDTNVMAGNAEAAGGDGRYGGMVYLEATEANGFAPALPDRPVDVIYLCFPNNPTGAVARSRRSRPGSITPASTRRSSCSTRRTRGLSRMIRSRTASTRSTEPACAIEFRSFSKTAGFTGTRCAFTVVPKELMGRTKDGREVSMHGLWGRRQNTKFNGVAYIVQRGAEAVYSADGRRQVRDLVDGYMAKFISEALSTAGLTVFGGDNAPYCWVKCPDGIDSWGMFDRLLEQAGVVCTPGVGFGRCGKGYFRLSGFNSRRTSRRRWNRWRRLSNPERRHGLAGAWADRVTIEDAAVAFNDAAAAEVVVVAGDEHVADAEGAKLVEGESQDEHPEGREGRGGRGG